METISGIMESVTEFFLGLILIFGLGEPAPPVYTGYVEGDYIYVSPTSSGRLEAIAVSPSDVVAAGNILFTQDRAQAKAAVLIVRAKVAIAQAQLENSLSGARKEEIEVIQAQLEMAQANLLLAEQTVKRNAELAKGGVASQTRVDAGLAQLASAKAQTRQLRAQISAMSLPARPAERQQAKANLAAAEAELAQSITNLSMRTIVAPVGGTIEQVFYDAGEVAQPGMPILSLLPEDGRVIRFFIPEPDRAGFAVGSQLLLECTGCPPDVRVELTYIDQQPQFTPPIIYSRDERARLVYRAEARPLSPLSLFPGQPVTLGLLP